MQQISTQRMYDVSRMSREGDDCELCKKLKFDHLKKWHMHNLESVLVIETHKLLLDSEIQMDHLISARRPDVILINKKDKTCRIVNFAVPADNRVKLKECEKRDEYFDLPRELKTR